MKIILSKKGIDSNCSSNPILLDKKAKEMAFIPIPGLNEPHTYSDLAKFLDLKKLFKDGKNKFRYDISIDKLQKPLLPCCHFDPQLKNYFETKNFLASFGQVDTAQQYLENAGVGIDDLFLFFSWYLDPKTNQEQNIILGYMQIGEILKLKSTEKEVLVYSNQDNFKTGKTQTKFLQDNPTYNFLLNQPHWINAQKYSQNNTIYIAKPSCAFDKTIPGFGLFKFNNSLVLTDKKAKTKTIWDIKELNKQKTIEIINQKVTLKNGKGQLVKGFGQEFVFKENESVTNWAKTLIKNN